MEGTYDLAPAKESVDQGAAAMRAIGLNSKDPTFPIPEDGNLLRADAVAPSLTEWDPINRPHVVAFRPRDIRHQTFKTVVNCDGWTGFPASIHGSP